MIEYVVTSSVLMAAVIVLRSLFRRRISRRLQYALWGLVLLRLLMPFSLFASSFSVMNMVPHSNLKERQAHVLPASRQPVSEPPGDRLGNVAAGDPDSPGYAVSPEGEMSGSRYTASMSVGRALSLTWLSGGVAAGLWFAATNLVFYRHLRKTRQECSDTGCGLPVFVTEHIASPCLFGIIRPAIYLTPKTLENGKSVRHVLAHELCHYRHGDHLWSIMRVLCLAGWWWNPLVWAAAVLSREDSELACDEAVMREIGEEDRLAYGHTLVDMIAVRRPSAGLMCATTTMISRKSGIKERLDMIVSAPKAAVSAMIAVPVLVAVFVGCTFTGARATAPLSAQEALSQLAASVAHSSGAVSFLVPEDYEKPEEWDIHIHVAGRQQFADEFSQSTHVLEDTNDAKAWEPGKQYVISIDDAYTELTLTAFLPGEGGETLEKSVDLLFPEVDMAFSSDSTDLEQLGLDAAMSYYSQFMGDQVPKHWHITKYETLSCRLMAGDQREFAVWITSTIETDGGGFLVGEGTPADPDDLTEGGICPEVGRQFRVKALGGGKYEIVSVGTGGSDGGLEPVERSMSYELIQLRHGEALRVLMPLSGNDAELAGGVVADYLLKSAAWQGVDVKALGECYLLQATYPDGTTTDYYAYLMDGKAVMQRGDDGHYSRIDDGLYERLVKLAHTGTLVGGANWPGNIPAIPDPTNLEACVSHAILSNNAGRYDDCDFAAEAHTVLKTVENEDSATVYAMALYMEFRYAGGGFSDSGGSHMPVAITFEKNAAGEYQLKEYWMPQDGDGYAPSIREKFPPDIYEDALPTQKYILAHIQSCYAQAVEYGKVDTGTILAKLLLDICSSPAEESDPLAYVQAHRIEFREMTYYGRYTLRYCFGLFEQGGQTGLKGHIMALACRDVLGEAEDTGLAGNTGQDWYEAFKGSAQDLRRQNGDDYVEENKPGSWLLLQMLDAKTD